MLGGKYADLRSSVPRRGAGKRPNLHLARQRGSGDGSADIQYPIAIFRGEPVFFYAFGKQEAAPERTIGNLPVEIVGFASVVGSGALSGNGQRVSHHLKIHFFGI